MRNNLYPILFAIFLIVFIVLKISVLSLPYYWDELGVYVPGMHQIIDRGTIGILPADLDPLYSRGHPLLFYFIGANFFRIFGQNIFTGHLLSILIACSTLFVCYRMCSYLFSKRVALVATLLLGVQPLFFTMSGILLPEMLLTLWILLSIWGICSQKWWMYMIAASLAILTKEVAIILPPLALGVLFVDALMRKDFFSLKRWSLFLCAVMPLIVFGIFLFIQKSQNGWYFFPEHMGWIKISWLKIRDGFYLICREVGIDEYRWFLSIFLISGILLSLMHQKLGPQMRPILIFIIFILIATVFSKINFYISRYMLIIYPFFIILCVLGIDNFKWVWNGKVLAMIYISIAAASISLSSSVMYDPKYKGVPNMTYTYTVQTVQKCIEWVQAQGWNYDSIRATFPIKQAMEDSRNGYVSESKRTFAGDYIFKTKYALVYPIIDDPYSNHWKYDSLIRTFDKGFSHIFVYTSTAK